MNDYAPPPGFVRLQLDLQYLGTHFQGWQVQGKGERTVQGVLHEAMVRFSDPHLPVACGRTDTGVHAVHMPVHIDVQNLRLPVERLARALNAMLPADVAVLKVCVAPAGFHARFSCQWRQYRYQLYLAPQRAPLWEERALWVSYALDLEKVQEACSCFIGEHDFRAFATQEERQTRRTVYGCSMESFDHLWTLEVRGESFLRHQIRAMVGTLLKVGSGKMSISDLQALLLGAERHQAGPNVKPHGLHFLGAGY